MPIDLGTMQYVQPVHTGTREEVIRALMDEASGIANDSFMRDHARGRELGRIQRQLAGIGVEMMIGTEEDKGYFLAIDGHRPECQVEKTGTCDCPPFYKVEGSF